MKERGIIFDAESVRAILAGAKIQTRRVIKPQPPNDCGRILGPEWYEPAVIDKYGDMVPGKPVYGIYDEWGEWGIKCPYQPGDRLYVKEAWATLDSLDSYSPSQIEKLCLDAGYYAAWCPVEYADFKRTNWPEDSPVPLSGRGRSPMHMPKWAARIWLEVLSVRVERVQSISLKDVMAEGVVEVCLDCDAMGELHRSDESHYLSMDGENVELDEFIDVFEARWDAINRRRGYSWESNPFVWVISFRRI